MIDKTVREQLETHLLEFADDYGPWAVLLVVTEVLKPLLKNEVRRDIKRSHSVMTTKEGE